MIQYVTLTLTFFLSWRLQRYGDGWTEDGREYYQLLLGTFKNLKSSDAWNTLQDYWKMYQKKHYNKGNDVQDDEEGGKDKVR